MRHAPAPTSTPQNQQAGIAPPRTAILSEARRWIGTPYHHRASVCGVGTDCLGLIRGIWRALYGDEPEPLPDYPSDWAEATGREDMLAAALRHFQPTGTPCPGDILLFRLRVKGPARHVGILSEGEGRLTLIHALSPHFVTEAPLTDHWQRRVAAAFTFP